MQIYLNQDTVLDKELTNDAILVYTALRAMLQKTSNYYWVTPQIIYGLLINKNRKCSRGEKELVERGLRELQEKRYLYIKSSCEYVYQIKMTAKMLVNGKQERFIIVDQKDIDKILFTVLTRLDDNEEYVVVSPNRLILFRYYLILLTTVNPEITKCYGSMVIDKLVEMSDYNERSIMRYNTYLEQLEIIYIYRSQVKIVNGGTVTGVSNMYGRFEHKEIIERNGKLRDAQLIKGDKENDE